MWIMTTAEGAVNFDFVRKIYIQKANWIFNNKTYSCAVTVEFSDNEKRSIDFFYTENDAKVFVSELIDELNKSKGVAKC